MTTSEQGRRHASDDEHVLAAALQGRIVLSHNRRDFLLLHDAWRRWPSAFGLVLPPHPGILILDQTGDEMVADAVIRFLVSGPPHPLANALYWWRLNRDWHQPTADRRWVPYP